MTANLDLNINKKNRNKIQLIVGYPCIAFRDIFHTYHVLSSIFIINEKICVNEKSNNKNKVEYMYMYSMVKL